MSRIQISLPDAAIDQLRATAAATGEPTSRVGPRLLLSALAGEVTAQPLVRSAPETEPEEPRPKLRPKRGTPPWLEPLDEDEARIWLQDMWGSVVALCRRYPTALGHLPEGWWRDTQLVELLCCMATWRVNIDIASEDPRKEFAFHTGLQRSLALSTRRLEANGASRSAGCRWTGAAHGSRRRAGSSDSDTSR
jgi:hypothetical protein